MVIPGSLAIVMSVDVYKAWRNDFSGCIDDQIRFTFNGFSQLCNPTVFNTDIETGP